MFLLAILCMVASTFALPALELPSPPEALTLFVSRTDLDTIVPSDEKPEINTNDDEVKPNEISINQPIDQSDNENGEEQEKITGEGEKRIIVLSAIPSPPELPPLEESLFASLLKAEKSEDLEDGSGNAKPYILKWKLPNIRFPGRDILEDVFGPHLVLKVSKD